MLTATKSGNSILLKTSLSVNYQLERKLNSGSWEPWNGTDWGGVPVSLSTPNFTDYDLADGIYQYRTFVTDYEYSTCIVIGSAFVGWTFDNYTVPDGLFGEILTADDIQQTYLWGIDLTASNGTPWSEAQSRTLISWAVAQLERELNIDIFWREYYASDGDEANETPDIIESEYVIKEFPYPNRRRKRFQITSRHRPIREVTRFDFYSPVDTKILNLMPWLRTDKYKGIFRYYPKQGALQTYAGYGWPWNYILEQMDYPDAFYIDYKTGYKSAAFLPRELRDVVGKLAALKMLNAIGDGLLAGFSSSSISLDGLSESFSSTQSATSAYFGARIKVYQDEVKAYLDANRHKYGNFQIGSI